MIVDDRRDACSVTGVTRVVVLLMTGVTRVLSGVTPAV